MLVWECHNPIYSCGRIFILKSAQKLLEKRVHKSRIVSHIAIGLFGFIANMLEHLYQQSTKVVSSPPVVITQNVLQNIYRLVIITRVLIILLPNTMKVK